jgi:hypothetical protein
LPNVFGLSHIKSEIEYASHAEGRTEVHETLQEACCGEEGWNKEAQSPNGWNMERDNN